MADYIDDRSPTAKALSKVSQISTISLMMVIPAFLGYFVDQHFNTVILFTALGLVVGVVGAVFQLIRLVASEENKANSDTDQSKDDVDSSSRTT